MIVCKKAISAMENKDAQKEGTGWGQGSNLTQDDNRRPH